MKRIFIVLSTFLIISTGCNQKDDLINCDFDQEAMLTNYADNIIIPRFENLNLGLAFLHSSVLAFKANPTAGLLVEIRVSFGAAYLAYQDCSPFGFGPALINGVSFRERFNTFPTNVAAIEANISSGSTVLAGSKSAVGFPAIEYLIFGDGTMTEQQLLEAFTTGLNADARMAYLEDLATEMKNTGATISEHWDSSRSAFISNTGAAEGSSISLLVNDLNFDFETLKNFKFKIPLGKFNGGAILPETVEGYYAGGSIQLAQRQLLGMREMFLGIGSNGADELGLYEFTECVKPLTNDEQQQGIVSLADEIKDQFFSIGDAMDLVPDPMSETLVSDKPIVDAVYLQLQMMTPLIKNEMTSAMGVQINYQDNDGD
ncbi:MAG: imelysin family protein [Flavobacteriales bacterium]|nr:imelysin family protein [Flavobacteriales bacterium]